MRLIGAAAGIACLALAAVVLLAAGPVGSARADNDPCAAGWTWNGETGPYALCSADLSTPGSYSLTAPANGISIFMSLRGADGGSYGGGAGGEESGNLVIGPGQPVLEGQKLTVIVGGAGSEPSCSTGAPVGGGGYGGGGSPAAFCGPHGYAAGGGGGGGSFVFGPTGLLIAAGGGGGGAGGADATNGGGGAGAAGGATPGLPAPEGGGAATGSSPGAAGQSNGGTGARAGSGPAKSPSQLGVGGSGSYYYGSCGGGCDSWSLGAGGGGGYYGGGGGGSTEAFTDGGGGGGSGYVDPHVLNADSRAGLRDGGSSSNGDVTLQYKLPSCPLDAADTGRAAVASASASLHCTTTTLRCVNYEPTAGANGPQAAEEYLCEAVVTDVTPKNPSEPTGDVRVFVDYSSPGEAHDYNFDCQLLGRAPRYGTCEGFMVHGPYVAGETVTLSAAYGGDATHKYSASGSYPLLSAVSAYHQTTAGERAQLMNAANTETANADTGGFIGAGCALVGCLTIPVSAPIAATGAFVWAYAKVDADDKKKEASRNDPLDPRYATVAKPRVVRFPRLPSLPGPAGPLIRKLLTNVLTESAIVTAQGTAEDRASTAALVGDNSALGKQRHAIAKDFNELADLTLSNISLEKKLGSALKHTKVTIKAGKVKALRDRIARSSPPSYVVAILKAAGESRSEAVSSWRALAQFVRAGTFRVSSLFTDPTVITAERQAAAILRTDAKSN